MRHAFSILGHSPFHIVQFVLPALLVSALISAQPLEKQFAEKFSASYRDNKERLKEIQKELKTLPTPYLREPTGTGGFLSRNRNKPYNKVAVSFVWKRPQKIDSVALFPLRLYMDTVYRNNLYWPKKINIYALIDGQQILLLSHQEPPLVNRKSLPLYLTFPAIETDKIVIESSSLQKHPTNTTYAAGFSEICLFSGDANVAPRATCISKISRQGYYVLAKEFLTDGQTPLGLPEQNHPINPAKFIKIDETSERLENYPYTITLKYADPIFVDSVRIDPAVQHAFSQHFPVKFAIELLDAEGNILDADLSHKKLPYPSPGLNPYFAYFQPHLTSGIRLKIFESATPHPKANESISLSEITALFEGLPQPLAKTISQHFDGHVVSSHRGKANPSKHQRALLNANDGYSQTGKILGVKEWTMKLHRYNQLLQEQTRLSRQQSLTTRNISQTLITSSITLVVLVLSGTVIYVIRNQILTNRAIRQERIKIASDLHDDVGSSLGSIVLNTERLMKTIQTGRERARLEMILRLTRESTFGLREVLNATAPDVARTQNIVAYMKELAHLMLGQLTFSFQASPDASESLLDYRARKGLLLFYKEAVHNAKKHSECTHIDIKLSKDESCLTLVVKDNGKGIPEKKLQRNHTLRTLKQRADWLNAKLDIISVENKGTQITLQLDNPSP